MDRLRIKEWLDQKRKTQSWLAEQLGVTFASVNKWINGRGAISPAFKKLITRMMNEGEGTQDDSLAPSASLTDEQIDTAAQSIGKSSKELIRGVLYHVSDKIADVATSEEKDH